MRCAAGLCSKSFTAREDTWAGMCPRSPVTGRLTPLHAPRTRAPRSSWRHVFPGVTLQQIDSPLRCHAQPSPRHVQFVVSRERRSSGTALRPSVLLLTSRRSFRCSVAPVSGAARNLHACASCSEPRQSFQRSHRTFSLGLRILHTMVMPVVPALRRPLGLRFLPQPSSRERRRMIPGAPRIPCNFRVAHV